LSRNPKQTFGDGPYPFPIESFREIFDVYESDSLLMLDPKPSVKFDLFPGSHHHTDYEFLIPYSPLEHVGVEEKEINPLNGGLMLLLVLAGFALSCLAMVIGCIKLSSAHYVLGGFLLAASIVMLIVFSIMSGGFHILNPNEALVMTLFGKYYGTIKKEGFYYTNPFAGAINPAKGGALNVTIGTGTTGTNAVASTAALASKKISTKTLTLNNEKQKVNDVLGNPIIIGAIVIWRVSDPTKAVFNVENYKTFLSIQCDSTIRNIARLYPYDTMEDDTDEKTLRGSSQEIADSMRAELQQRVSEAGLRFRR
jgi:hypothetical protein